MSSKLSALTEISIPSMNDLMYIADPDAANTENKVTVSRLMGLLNINQFRLTTESLVPVSTTERLAQGTIYLTPTVNSPAASGSPGTGLITLFDGTRPLLYSAAEASLSLSGIVAADTNYDVFAFNNAGVLTLELTAWTNNVTRATGLVAAGGLLVKSGVTTRTYIGTIRGSAMSQTTDSMGGVTTQVGGKRFVWNMYNRIWRLLKIIDTSSAWSYNTATVRAANGVTNNRVELVQGLALDNIIADVYATLVVSNNPNVAGVVGVGVDSSAQFEGFRNSAPVTAFTRGSISASLMRPLPIGYHFLTWCEWGNQNTGTITWSPSTTSLTANENSGMVAQVMC